VARLRFELSDERSDLFLPFVGVDSETDAFPLGEVREFWSPPVLVREDQERSRVEDRYRPFVIKASKELIAYASSRIRFLLSQPGPLGAASVRARWRSSYMELSERVRLRLRSVIHLTRRVAIRPKELHKDEVDAECAHASPLARQRTHRASGGRGAVLDAELHEHLLEVLVYRARADVEDFADFAVGFAAADP
jgi:hypothetical protein